MHNIILVNCFVQDYKAIKTTTFIVVQLGNSPQNANNDPKLGREHTKTAYPAGWEITIFKMIVIVITIIRRHIHTTPIYLYIYIKAVLPIARTTCT